MPSVRSSDGRHGTAQPMKAAARSDGGGVARRLENHAGDLHGVIGEPLIEPAERGHVDRGGDPVFLFTIHQHPE
jgi:hypothetical protein